MLTLKERGIHAYLARHLLWQYLLIDIFFRLNMSLSLTLKERGIHAYLTRHLLWQYL